MGAHRAMLAKVHIARKELGLDEATYRATLSRVTGQESASGCTQVQLDAALSEFRRLGWKPKKWFAPQENSQVRMIHAIWKDLRPYLREPGREALRAFVVKQTAGPLHPQGVSAPEFLDAKQANQVIEALKAWRAREKAAEAARAVCGGLGEVGA